MIGWDLASARTHALTYMHVCSCVCLHKGPKSKQQQMLLQNKARFKYVKVLVSKHAGSSALSRGNVLVTM